MSDHKTEGVLDRASDRLKAISNAMTAGPQFKFPEFDELLKGDSKPQGNIWGVFDRDGVKDEIGTLNLLTPEVVREAAKEIRTGERVQLDWCLSDNVEFPGFGRLGLKQRVIDAKVFTKGAIVGFDDELNFNTQAGSQWDSLKHFAHQKTGMYYNGLSHADAAQSSTNGIHRWCERGGIVGRGVLVDWLSWYETFHGTAPSPVSSHEIPITEVDECLRWQGTSTRPGDILIVRSGYTRWHDNADTAERKRGTKENSQSIGLQSNEATVRWLYDRRFAAVAGDTLALEAWPTGPKSGWCLHEWLLVLWGTPIGELWNLEELSEVCKAEKRWTFFMTSAPLHVKGGVGSPPGAIAIF